MSPILTLIFHFLSIWQNFPAKFNHEWTLLPMVSTLSTFTLGSLLIALWLRKHDPSSNYRKFTNQLPVTVLAASPHIDAGLCLFTMCWSMSSFLNWSASDGNKCYYSSAADPNPLTVASWSCCWVGVLFCITRYMWSALTTMYILRGDGLKFLFQNMAVAWATRLSSCVYL